jgi:hypothetical protein
MSTNNGVMVSASYSGNLGFEFRPGRLISIVFPSVIQTKRWNNNFWPRPPCIRSSRFMVHYYPVIRRYTQDDRKVIQPVLKYLFVVKVQSSLIIFINTHIAVTIHEPKKVTLCCNLLAPVLQLQGRGVHVTGVSVAYTFKLNKNILSE